MYILLRHSAHFTPPRNPAAVTLPYTLRTGSPAVGPQSNLHVVRYGFHGGNLLTETRYNNRHQACARLPAKAPPRPVPIAISVVPVQPEQDAGYLPRNEVPAARVDHPIRRSLPSYLSLTRYRLEGPFVKQPEPAPPMASLFPTAIIVIFLFFSASSTNLPLPTPSASPS